jgi:hypothetical protein
LARQRGVNKKNVNIEKIMKKGFELLKKKTTIFNISELEQQYDVNWPPLFKLFLNYFDIFGECYAGEVVYKKKINHMSSLVSVAFKPSIYSLDISPMPYADNLPALFESWRNDMSELEWTDYGFVRIFTVGLGAIFVGTRDQNKDAIYRVLWHKTAPEKLADNIFEFIDGLEALPIDEYFFNNYGFKVNQLYKNWGEDFYRITEE